MVDSEYTQEQIDIINGYFQNLDYPAAYLAAARFADGQSGADQYSVAWLRGAASVNAHDGGAYDTFIHLAELDSKIAAMRDMADTLRRLAEACAGSARPDCPILHGLESGTGARAPSGRGMPAQDEPVAGEKAHEAKRAQGSQV